MREGLFRTYTLNGACFLIRTDVFREAGWFDERFFFTPEDIALGDLLNRRGYTVWADADVAITHVAGGSVSALEAAIKPARVRGSLLFYGEPLPLKLLIWCYEALRVCKYALLPRTPRNALMRRTAVNVMHTVFSDLSPKEIFIRCSHG
jgi:GT2 family glycosyltransferase